MSIQTGWPVFALWAVLIVATALSALRMLLKRGGNVSTKKGPDDRKHWRLAALELPSDRQAEFLTCTFSLLGKIAAVDGRISNAERARIERYIEDQLHLTERLRGVALAIFRDAFDSPVDYREYVEKFRKSFPDRVQLADSLVDALLEIALADGEIVPEEEQLIRSIALLLGMTEPYFQLRKAQHLGYN